MKSSSLRIACFLAFAVATVFNAGCGYGYLMQAQDWGARIQDGVTKLQEVQSMAASPATFFANAQSQKTALAKLDEVDAIFSAIEAEYPESPPSYHDYLEEGINEMQAAIVTGREGIEKKNLKKLETFRDQANAAGAKLRTWGNKAQGN